MLIPIIVLHDQEAARDGFCYRCGATASPYKLSAGGPRWARLYERDAWEQTHG